MGSLIIIFIVIALIVATLFLKKLFQTPKFKGMVGEAEIVYRITMEIRHGLDGFVLHNVYIPKETGGTAEIDVLFITRKGVFVFESKNYCGYIFGNDKSKYWTVSLYAGKDWLGRSLTRKIKFYNPIWQNRTHIKALQRIIDPSIPAYSLIIFSDRSTIMSIDFDPEKSQILQSSQLNQFFSNVCLYYPDTVTTDQINDIYNLLIPYAQAQASEKNAHIETINVQKNNPIICPWCGGNLILRTARKGPHPGTQFYGCSNYPKCKYTRKIDYYN